MNGNDLYNSAVILLGYADSQSGNCLSDSIRQRALGLICQLCRELGIAAPKTLNEPIQTNQTGLDALSCGLAMLLSLTEADADKNRIFTQLYNAKRGSFKGDIYKISDVLPSVGGGG